MSTDLARIPSYRSLGLGSDTLSVETARDRLAAIGKADPEHGHGLADEILCSALRLIAEGHGNPRKVAADALVICSAEFPRWCA